MAIFLLKNLPLRTILFLHDTALNTLRGAELTIVELMELGQKKGYSVKSDSLVDFDKTKKAISRSDLVILNSSSRCAFEQELIKHLVSQPVPYVKCEYDYNFCTRRNILCTVTRQVKNCCVPDKFHLYRELFAKATFCIFQSPEHYRAHKDFYGEAICNHLIMPPTVKVEKLKPLAEKDEKTIPFFGDLNLLKGGNEYVDYAEKYPEFDFPVYGKNWLNRELPPNISFHEPIPNEKVLEILGRTKRFICQPVWPEPSGRLAAEAFLSGCEIVANDRVGTFSFDFYPNDPEKAKAEMQQAPHRFWEEVDKSFSNPEGEKTLKLGKVLVYKSYGGLGDIFFAVPAIYKLTEVSEEIHFAVASRLVDFFSNYLKIKVIAEEEAKTREKEYDHIYELGNYPAFRGYDLPHAMRYPTHKKVKQHAIRHYIDAVAKLHPEIDNGYTGYPYFPQKNHAPKKHYTIHPGAGFLLKIWPTENYARLIEQLHEIFPSLDCKIIKGPDDPEIEEYFSRKMPHIEYITGGMMAVGKAMEGALFHIGNDAGISHVAGAFDVPSVGIYGPTGPGSWGIFPQQAEVIWGKKGVCNLKCNYDVILNCGHRVCLTSISVDRVLEALYKVLQKAYPREKSNMKINPVLETDFGEKECMLKVGQNEFLLEFHDGEMRDRVRELLFNGSSGEMAKDETWPKVMEVLKSQHVFFEVPEFA